ncbi:hypothetical protein GGI07_003004 [Coemansia sp. Benny D115]|nr:hypothetical protein GGI07_003004 [Coemansia sp. Benny D115]
MQRFVVPSIRCLARAGLSSTSRSSLAALTSCSRLLTASQAPAAPQVSAFARYYTSEALAREESSAEERVGSSGSDAAADSAEYVPVPFRNYKSLNPKTLEAIERVMKFKEASKVQDQVISRMPITKDTMIKAKTGTGKTTAFLVPAIEALVREYQNDPHRGKKGNSIGCLIVSPTRELAHQIATEARKLTFFHRWNVQSLIGGESAARQSRDLLSKRCDIVVGTPGRIIDFYNNNKQFKGLASNLKLLIFDEADVLLQMGFRSEIEQIIQETPKDRQSFLVSATMDRKIRELVPTVFESGFDLIDCVDKGETNTHQHVKQEYVQAEMSQHFPLLCDIVNSHIAKNKLENRGSKIIIFTPTVKTTDMYANVLRMLIAKNASPSSSNRNNMRGGDRNRNSFNNRGSFNSRVQDVVDVMCLHGKISQETRTRRSNRFRESPLTANNASILVTTDVSARGVDYPDVSLVIQLGIPSETEAYIHRLGRTGRAGKSGEGIAIYTPLELTFLKNLKNVPITPSEKYTENYLADLESWSTSDIKDLEKRWDYVKMNLDAEVIQSSYVAMIAFYQAHGAMIGEPRGMDIVETMKPLLATFDTPEPPLPSILAASLRDKSGSRGFSRGGQRGSYGNNRGNDRRGSYGGDRSGNRRGGYMPRNGQESMRGTGGYQRNWASRRDQHSNGGSRGGRSYDRNSRDGGDSRSRGGYSSY